MLIIIINKNKKGTVAIGSFGYPPKSDQPAIDAVKAANEIYQILKKQKNILSNIGIAYGKHIYCGLFGAINLRQEFSLIGRSVNLAARLMSYAIKKKVPIVCDEFIKNETTHVFVCIENSFMAKGFIKPIEIFSPTIKNNGLFCFFIFFFFCIIFFTFLNKTIIKYMLNIYLYINNR
jgi:class 3 adenylate cyclase